MISYRGGTHLVTQEVRSNSTPAFLRKVPLSVYKWPKSIETGVCVALIPILFLNKAQDSGVY